MSNYPLNEVVDILLIFDEVIEITNVRHTSMLNDILMAGIQLIAKSAILK